MPDDLQYHFDAFRTESTRLTQPPGVPAIRRTLARRHATRAAAFAGATVAALVLLFLPGHPKAPVGPSQPPPQSSSPTPSGSPSPLPSASPSASPHTKKPPTTPPPTSPGCAMSGNFRPSSLLGSSDANTFSLTSALLKACPDAHLHITRTVYVGTGASSSRLTLYATTMHTLTPEAPTTVMLAGRLPAGSCFTSVTVTVIGSNLPHSIPNVVPAMEGDGSDDAAQSYFLPRGFDVIDTTWSQPSC